jgi:hypothetical protein
VYNVSEIRQLKIHTGEPLVPDPSPFEDEDAIVKMENYKWPGSDRILT